MDEIRSGSAYDQDDDDDEDDRIFDASQTTFANRFKLLKSAEDTEKSDQQGLDHDAKEATIIQK